MITDGNIVDSNGRKTVRLSISKSDEYILEEFKTIIKSNNKITHDNRGNGMSSFAIESEIIVSDLERYGVVPRKTFKCFLPKIKKEFMPHLIRGCIDGDGWITRYIQHREKRNDRECISIGFCGVGILVEQLKEFLVKELDVYNVKIHKSKDGVLQCIWASRKDVQKIANYIYKDANYYLTRKYEKIKDLL